MITIKVCLRCSEWKINNVVLDDIQKDAVTLLSQFDIFRFENEICSCCRQEIGDDVAEQILTFFEK